MRYRGKEYKGQDITVAVIDSGIDVHNPALADAYIDGWSIQLGATGHAVLSSDFHDEHGHGTQIATAIRKQAPEARILAIKIMGKNLRTSAELMAAGIETAAKNGADIINLSLGTPNMGKALLLRDCCANAVQSGSVVLAAAHPKGERAYPADLPEAIGVASHPDCPLHKFFYFNPKKFSKTDWGALSGKFLAHGYDPGREGLTSKYRGSGIACAYMSGVAACLAQAKNSATPEELTKALFHMALLPIPELGYS